MSIAFTFEQLFFPLLCFVDLLPSHHHTNSQRKTSSFHRHILVHSYLCAFRPGSNNNVDTTHSEEDQIISVVRQLLKPQSLVSTSSAVKDAVAASLAGLVPANNTDTSSTNKKKNSKRNSRRGNQQQPPQRKGVKVVRICERLQKISEIGEFR